MTAPTAEVVHIAFKRYRCPGGEPTCCADAEAGMTCGFFGGRSFGTRDVCMFGEQTDLPPRGMSYTRPRKGCPLWPDTQEQAPDPGQDALDRMAEDARELGSDY